MKSDDGLRAILRARLRHAGHWISIETGGTDQGVPDTNLCMSGGIEVWIECKATRGLAVRMRPAQVGWIEARMRRGGNCWIAVRRRAPAGPRRGEAVDQLWLIDGALVRALAESGLDGVQDCEGVHAWPGGPTRWNFIEVVRVLCRHAPARGTVARGRPAAGQRT